MKRRFSFSSRPSKAAAANGYDDATLPLEGTASVSYRHEADREGKIWMCCEGAQ